MQEKNLLLIGGGGHCRSIIDSLMQSNQYTNVGIIDFNVGSDMGGLSVVGNDDDLTTLYQNKWNYAFVSLGSIESTEKRRRLYEKIRQIGFIIPSIIDTSSVVAHTVRLGIGCYIGKGVVINANSKIGDGCIINTRSVIEHDCMVGEFSHISTGSILCGEVCIGADTHIGAGTVIRQQINIGYNSIIGIGSVVVKDIPNNVKAFGNPCRVIESYYSCELPEKGDAQ